MDSESFWNSVVWDRIKKLSALASIIAAFVAIAWFGYTVWRDRSVGQPQPVSSQTGGSVVNLWTPTYVIGGCVILTAVIHLLAAFMSRRSLKRQLALANAAFLSKEEETEELQTQHAKTALKYATSNRDKLKAEAERDGLANRISELTIRLGTVEANHAFQIEELNSKLDAKIEEVKTAKREAETANLRADSEAQDKRFTRELKERAENQLANLDWLYALAKEQAQDISAHVTVSLVTYPHSGELQLTGNDLCILVGLAIKNESVFNISVEDKEITGHFGLKGVAFKENAGQLIDDLRPPLHGLKPKQREILVLEQPLRQFEAEKIQKCLSDDDTKLVIKNLRIPISASNSAMRVEPKLLRLGNGEVPLKNLAGMFREQEANAES